MKTKAHLLALSAILAFAACSKHSGDIAPAAGKLASTNEITAAAASTITYTDESAFINSLSSYGPHGAEDLYRDAVTGYLWCLTEYETEKYGQDNRCVFAVRLSDYD